MECHFCGFNDNRENVYGRICPKCKEQVLPIKHPKFVIENEQKLIQNQEKVRNIFRNNILGDKKCL